MELVVGTSSNGAGSEDLHHRFPRLREGGHSNGCELPPSRPWSCVIGKSAPAHHRL